MGFLPKGFGLRALLNAPGVDFPFLLTLWHCVLFVRLAAFLHIWQASTVRVQDIPNNPDQRRLLARGMRVLHAADPWDRETI